MKNFKAVILAGGKGTRLYPITKEIPKPLLPIKKKPIINYLVDLFHSQGVKEIAVLISHDFQDDFQWWRKRYYPKSKIKLVEEKKPFGTFGGLFLLRKWIGGSLFFLTNGDELKIINLKRMAEFHQKMAVPVTIAMVKVSDPQNYGVVVSKKGKIEKFLEKPSPSQLLKEIKNWEGSNYINSGLYLLSSEVFDFHPGLKFSMIEADLFPKLAGQKKLAGFKFRGKWTDCGTWERYEKAISTWK
jgi:NDP-sugar pyrophosphorylase family protein